MTSRELPPLLVIVGPTAVGKTDLALRLAEHVELEVVSADSRQIYRHMDIGTAKPLPAERERVPHHLLDVVEPDRILTLAEYKDLAERAIAAIHSRGKLPALVGGTGLYVWAVVENWQRPQVPPRRELRLRLRQKAETMGALHLHRRLAEVDPEAAARIHPNNVRRVIRALEVHHATGMPISQQQRSGPPQYRCLIVGITAPREWLYARADERVEWMLELGLVDETRELLAGGYSPRSPAMSGLGYRQIAAYLLGQCELDEAIRRMKTATHRFIRQQYTWFRIDDRRISWFEQPVCIPQVVKLVRAFAGDNCSPSP